MKTATRRRCQLVVLAAVVGALVMTSYKRALEVTVSSIWGEAAQHRNGAPAKYDAAAESVTPAGGMLFQCPDGRLGLHVVHTRFLVNQADANRVFVASRLQLLRTFFIPSLNAQDDQQFVVFVAHDPALSATNLHVLRDTLGMLRAHSLTGGERNLITYSSLNHATLSNLLSDLEPRVRNVDLFITSRMDLDDAAHVGAVAGVQQHACAGGTSEADAVRLVYIHRGLLWYPSLEQPHGVTCEWSNKFVSHLAIMQSMVLSGAAVLRACPLNVYSYPHYKPHQLEAQRAPGCGASFNHTRHVYRWKPPSGGVGALYTKTASSWSHGKLQHRGLVCSPADPERLHSLFAVAVPALGLANLVFAGLEAEAAGLLVNSTQHQLER